METQQWCSELSKFSKSIYVFLPFITQNQSFPVVTAFIILCMKENIIIPTLFHESMAYNIIPVGVVTCHKK